MSLHKESNTKNNKHNYTSITHITPTKIDRETSVHGNQDNSTKERSKPMQRRQI